MPINTPESVGYEVTIRGIVQGVGFRPFLFRLAEEFAVNGWVENRTAGVVCHVEGLLPACKDFCDAISKKHPPLARVDSIESREVELLNCASFIIRKSVDEEGAVTEISPDIAVCENCLDDMKTLPNRIDFPFVNCTDCGPRFSIVKKLPYDRSSTSMCMFELCPSCQKEFDEVRDRRFHAQPTACSKCGPACVLETSDRSIQNITEIIAETRRIIEDGGIVAIKGLGGFHLAVNASDEIAVKNLRERKRRDGKPFAVMFADVEAVKNYAEISTDEESLLCSPERPIVILTSPRTSSDPLTLRVLRLQRGCLFPSGTEKQTHLTASSPSLKEKGPGNEVIASSVNNNLSGVGAMLPGIPLHHLLFYGWHIRSIVLTSGNISETPLVISDSEAREKFRGIADAILIHNRDIINRVDDSVCAVVGGKIRMIRRARGFVPSSLPIDADVSGIFAAGAELKSVFAIGLDRAAVLSQHIGDLKNRETFEFYKESTQRFFDLFRFAPVSAVCDLHPDLLSTRFAEQLGVPLMRVQHHHAHIASCCAENRFDGKVIGIALDGTGYGDDETIWGGEFLVGDYEGYERATSFDPLPLPGGDIAVRDVWRMGVSACLAANESLDEIPSAQFAGEEKTAAVITAIRNNINCPMTTSAGRLFDAAASIAGLCHQISFEAEAAMRFEAIADPVCKEAYSGGSGKMFGSIELLKCLIDDVRRKISPAIISARFHNGVVSELARCANLIAEKSGITTFALSGGVFQNRILLCGTESLLVKNGFTVLTHSSVPANDGGIAFGQLAIAAARR